MKKSNKILFLIIGEGTNLYYLLTYRPIGEENGTGAASSGTYNHNPTA